MFTCCYIIFIISFILWKLVGIVRYQDMSLKQLVRECEIKDYIIGEQEKHISRLLKEGKALQLFR
jgi:hypothetical protein